MLENQQLMTWGFVACVFVLLLILLQTEIRHYHWSSRKGKWTQMGLITYLLWKAKIVKI